LRRADGRLEAAALSIASTRPKRRSGGVENARNNAEAAASGLGESGPEMRVPRTSVDNPLPTPGRSSGCGTQSIQPFSIMVSCGFRHSHLPTGTLVEGTGLGRRTFSEESHSTQSNARSATISNPPICSCHDTDQGPTF
jgi:hypothetical protein